MPDLTVSAKLPSDDRNGLPSILSDLLDDPTTVRPVLMLVDVNKIVSDPSTGERVPTLRIRAAEPITGPDAAEIDRMLRRAAERRTGKVELPLEMEREIESITGDGADTTGDTAAADPPEET